MRIWVDVYYNIGSCNFLEIFTYESFDTLLSILHYKYMFYCENYSEIYASNFDYFDFCISSAWGMSISVNCIFVLTTFSGRIFSVDNKYESIISATKSYVVL